MASDRSAEDPKWIIAEVRAATFVKPAKINPQGTVLDWAAVTQWVNAVTGQPVTLSRIRDSLAWLVESRDARR